MNSLLEGLILPTSEPPANLTGMIDVGDITRLWRVYNAIPRINPNSTIPRLENFFWRIWGSDTLTSLDGEKLAGLFRGISENRDMGGFFRDGVRQAQTREDSGTAQTRAPIHGNGQTAPTRLPSILKKHNSQKNTLKTTKSARLLLPGPDGQILTHSPSTPPSPPPVRLGRLGRPMFIIGDPDEYPECESQNKSKSQIQKQSQPKSQTQTQTQKKITQFIARTRNSIKRRPTPSGGRKTRSSPTMSSTDKNNQNGQSRSLTPTPQTPSPASPVLSPLAAQGEVWVDLPDEVPELTEELLSETHTETKPIEQPPLTDTFINTLRAHMKANPVSANHGEDMAFHMDRYVYPNPPPEPRRIDIGTYRPWHRYQNRDRNETQNQPQSNNQTHTHTRNQTPQSPPMSLVEPGFRARFSGSLASSRAGTSPLAAAAAAAGAGVGNGIGSDSGSSTEVETECPESERQTGIPDPTPPVPVPGSRPGYGYDHGHGRGHGFNPNRTQTQTQRQAQAHGQTQTQAVNEQTFDDDDTSTIASENVAVESVISQFPIPPSRYNRMAPASGGPSASTNGTGSSFETISTPESDSQVQSQTEGQSQSPTLTQGQAQSQSEEHIQAQTQVHGQVQTHGQGQSDSQENEGQGGQVRGLRMDVTFEELEELCPPVW